MFQESVETERECSVAGKTEKRRTKKNNLANEPKKARQLALFPRRSNRGSWLRKAPHNFWGFYFSRGESNPRPLSVGVPPVSPLPKPLDHQCGPLIGGGGDSVLRELVYIALASSCGAGSKGTRVGGRVGMKTGWVTTQRVAREETTT